MLESFIRFVVVILWTSIIVSFIFRTKIYVELYKVMQKYTREFDSLGIDKYLLYIPEFCNLKKVKTKLDMSNFEISTLMKRLSLSKITLWGSIALFFIIGFFIYLFGKTN